MHDGDNHKTSQDERLDSTDPSQASPQLDNADDNQSARYPEPPSNWNEKGPGNPITPTGHQPRQGGQAPGSNGFIGKTVIKMDAGDAREFETGRKFVSAAQITALISLFFGGVLLSAVSIVLAILGYRSLSHIAIKRSNEPMVRSALKRSGIIAIVMSILALVINIVSLIAFYPMVAEMLQQGNLSSVFPGGGQAAPNGSGAPSGSSLFG